MTLALFSARDVYADAASAALALACQERWRDGRSRVLQRGDSGNVVHIKTESSMLGNAATMVGGIYVYILLLLELGRRDGRGRQCRGRN